MNTCFICQRIQLIKQQQNIYFVKELSTAYIVLGDHQYFKGYTLLLFKQHACELHELSLSSKQQFLLDMSYTAEAVFKAFKPQKLNYELLGNSAPHLHWHIFPRYANDLLPNSPVWLVNRSVRYAETAKPSPSELAQLKEKLLFQLAQILPKPC